MSKVGCAGLLVEDVFCGPLKALPPPGGLSLLPDMLVRTGGCAANVAIDLAKLGASVEVAGCVGNDSAGTLILQTLARCGIGTSGVLRLSDVQSSKTIILLVEGEDRRYLHVSGANERFSIEQLNAEWLSGIEVFYLGGLFGLPSIDFGDIKRLLERCQELEVKTVVDVITPDQQCAMDRLASLLPLIDMFVPNHDEARALTGLTDPVDQVQAFLNVGARAVIITQGAAGSIASDGSGLWRSGTFHMDTVDPSGSGDAFSAGVIHCMLRNCDLPTTLRYASALGASATRAAGTTDAVFTQDEVESFIAQHNLRVTHES